MWLKSRPRKTTIKFRFTILIISFRCSTQAIWRFCRWRLRQKRGNQETRIFAWLQSLFKCLSKRKTGDLQCTSWRSWRTTSRLSCFSRKQCLRKHRLSQFRLSFPEKYTLKFAKSMQTFCTTRRKTSMELSNNTCKLLGIWILLTLSRDTSRCSSYLTW